MRAMYKPCHTGCCITLCHNFRIRLQTSYQVRSIIPTWVWLSVITNVQDFNLELCACQ